MSTVLDMKPETKEAYVLKQWVVDNECLLHDRQSKAVFLRTESKERPITSLAEINAKKAHNTWQDESFWIECWIPTASFDDVYPYIGCENCGRKTEAGKMEKFNCSFCKSSNVTATQRANFSFFADDNTGEYKFIIFNDNVEALFRMTAEELVMLKNDPQSEQALEKINEIQNKKIHLNVAPANELSSSQILNWVVKSIITS